MTNNSDLSPIRIAQEYSFYKHQVDALKKEQEDLLAQVRVELEEKKRQELLSKINKD